MTGLRWCQKRGLKLVEPSTTLPPVFFAKAESALRMLRAAQDLREPDWMATTSYYAKYFALYGLFARCGVKCEIHDCTILAMKALLVDPGFASAALHEDIQDSKDLRVDLQYYAYREFDDERVQRLSHSAPEVVLQLRALADRLRREDIERIRAPLGTASR